MGKANSTKVRFYVKTVQNGVEYYNYYEKTCTLTGDIKTVWMKISDAWKHCKGWININGTNKRCVMWVNVSGVWKRCC